MHIGFSDSEGTDFVSSGDEGLIWVGIVFTDVSACLTFGKCRGVGFHSLNYGVLCTDCYSTLLILDL